MIFLLAFFLAVLGFTGLFLLLLWAMKCVAWYETRIYVRPDPDAENGDDPDDGLAG